MKNPVTTLKSIYRYPQRLLPVSIPDNGVLLVGTPLHRNLGDHLIAESEQRYLEDIYPGRKVIEIPTEIFQEHKEQISVELKPDIPVFITGGGWMGSLWPNDEMVLQEMIFCFRNNPLTILPQTVCYEPDDPEDLLWSMRSVMSLCRDIRFCARDEASFRFAEENFPVESILAPDMALLMEPSPVRKKNGVGFCLRKDRERCFSDETALRELFKDYPIREVDTMSKRRIPARHRRKSIERAIGDIGSCEVLVTDRLHAMIYAMLGGTKCIAFDNRTGKVRGIYEKWLSDDPNILFLREYDEKKVEEFLSKPYVPYEKDFRSDELREFVKRDETKKNDTLPHSE